MSWRVLVAGLLIVIGVGAVGLVVLGPTLGARDAPQYLTAAATRTNVVEQAVATGSVSAHATYALSFGEPAQLVTDASSSGGGSSTTWKALSVTVKVGETVKAGQHLATADTTDLKSQFESATASWRAASIERTIAQTALDDATTTDQTRQARIGLYNAEVQFAQAAKTRADLRDQIARARLTAPTAGTITAVNIAAGVTAPSGAAIEMEASPLEVTADFAESDLPALAVGQPATVTISAVNGTVAGKVTRITPVASSSDSSSVVTYAVTVSLDNAPTDVRSRMSADVSVATATATNVIAVPSIALSGANGNYAVRVLTADGQVEVRAVEVGLMTSSLAEIKSGLNAGDQVVTGTVSTRQNTTGGFGTGLGGGFGVRGGGQGQGGQGGQVQPVEGQGGKLP
jgi:macrolide-specific efflux system membrane fusion protein